jgi:DNA-directed RNA polymerase subunit RPC12/RpoP
MALIACSECKTEVSSTTHKCPKCGFTIRVPKRGFFGKVFKWTFVLWNVLMLWWLVSGMNAASHVKATDDAEKAGRAIGTALGGGIIVAIWVAGAVILGLFVLFTRPKS